MIEFALAGLGVAYALVAYGVGVRFIAREPVTTWGKVLGGLAQLALAPVILLGILAIVAVTGDYPGSDERR